MLGFLCVCPSLEAEVRRLHSTVLRIPNLKDRTLSYTVKDPKADLALWPEGLGFCVVEEWGCQIFDYLFKVCHLSSGFAILEVRPPCRDKGEWVAFMGGSYRWWFCCGFHQYSGAPSAMVPALRGSVFSNLIVGMVWLIFGGVLLMLLGFCFRFVLNDCV